MYMNFHYNLILIKNAKIMYNWKGWEKIDSWTNHSFLWGDFKIDFLYRNHIIFTIFFNGTVDSDNVMTYLFLENQHT